MMMQTQLTDLSAIRVQGEDANTFLGNLLTSTLPSPKDHSSDSTAQLSGFCSPKGRLLASFWITSPEINHYLLWISTDLAADFVKKLSMYRLRSKVEIALLSESIIGVLSDKPFENIPCQLPSVKYQDTLYFRGLEASNQALLEPTTASLWNLLEVISGIPRITQATKEQFVPQMINFESLQGVDFKKGCYPGQEVVARSQYRGTIKRRLKLGWIDYQETTPLMPIGTLLLDEEDPEQPAGMVVLSEIDLACKRLYFQAEVQLEKISRILYLAPENRIYFEKVHLIDPPYSLIEI